MRDPDLVLQARQAAIALERAWQRWRAVDGLEIDPVSPIASYVGYSLEEPWGQPRVVFGLAAEEAEQLAGLLDRHDCVGQAYPAVESMPAGKQVPDRPASLAAHVRIPRQTSPSAAERPVPDDRRSRWTSDPPESAAVESLGLPDWRPERGAHGFQVPGFDLPVVSAADGESSDRDEPVFRQAAAASWAAAAARESARAAFREAEAREAEAQDARAWETGAWETGVGDAEVRETGAWGTGVRDVEVRDAEAREAAAAGEQEDQASFAGPLTQAASAARAEAEARIKAALQERRSWAPVENPYAGGDPDSMTADTATFAAVDAAVGLVRMPRSEAASGALAWPSRMSPEFQPGLPSDPGSGWADHEPGATTEIRQPAGLAFLAGPELAEYLDAGPESDPYFDGTVDGSAAGFTKWNRMTRGHAIPRLPRTRRPGAAPGT